MGIDVWNLRFLCEAKRRFGSFGNFVQMGRQELHIPSSAFAEADAELTRAGIETGYATLTSGKRWADESLFQSLGATSIACADASDYEGADLVHDFNDPVDVRWRDRFDTLFDGGSLEHIFNVPGVLANEMAMLRVGGRLLAAVPANNWLGHGFYQFSPELPFRVFTPENGFRMECAFFSEMSDDRRLHQIEDLARRAGGEIGATRTNTTLYYVASKTADVTPFCRWPQQGDYDKAWAESSATRSK